MSFNYKIFLGSQSPRRRELVKELFNDVSTLDLFAEEPRWNKKDAPIEYLRTCVEFKATQARLAFEKEKWSGAAGFIVADTIVALGKAVLGKPVTAADARKMLRQLSGKTHQVYTGFCLGLRQMGSQLKLEERTVCSHVTFRKLTAREIAAYVKTGSPMDKAGAYGFQDQALRFVNRVEGSYLNIVGLPLVEIDAAARELGWR